MKKFSLLLILFVAALTLNAQVFTEYFETATTGGDLEGYNDWYLTFKSSEAGGVSPVIAEDILFYDGYIGSDIGKSVKLDSLVGMDSDDGTKRISTKVVTFGPGDTLRPVTGGSMYAAFIVSIGKDSKHSYRDFFTWEGSTGSSWQRGRVFVNVDGNGTDLKFAVSKNSSSSGDLDEAMVEVMGGVDIYHLLVLKYEAIEGDGNDVISLYVNPDPTKSEEEQVNKVSNFDNNSDYSEGTEIKIDVRQRGIGALIGGIRVGTNWEEVLKGGPDVSVTGVTLDQETLTLDAGATGTLVATVAPEDATNNSVVWSSNNEAVATVAEGVVTAVTAGEATITVTTDDGAFTASCVVTVNDATGVNNFEASGFSMYPNPVSDGILNVNISEANKALSIEIYDVLGVLVHREKIENRSSFQLSTSGLLKKGIYLVKIDSNIGSHIEQLIIE